MNYISIFPEKGSFGFSIHYNEYQIYIPGYRVGKKFFMEDDRDEKSELRFILEEDFGCSYDQINNIKYLIQHNLCGEIEFDRIYTSSPKFNILDN